MSATASPIAFDWRRVTADDVSTLAALYRDAALRLGPLVYTPEQARAWASSADDAPAFGKYVLDADTWIAQRPGDARALGFCGVATEGEVREVHSLYVAPGCTRRGLGTGAFQSCLFFGMFVNPVLIVALEKHFDGSRAAGIGFVGFVLVALAIVAGLTGLRHRD